MLRFGFASCALAMGFALMGCSSSDDEVASSSANVTSGGACSTTSTSTYYSGTQEYDGADPADVLSRCKSAYYEDQAKCAANLTCTGTPSSGVCITTSTSTYYSGEQEFDGADPVDVLGRCKSAYYEDQAKCAANIRCVGTSAIGLCVTTSTSTYYSGEQEFDGTDANDVLSRCKSAYYEDQAKCAANLRCIGNGHATGGACSTTSTSTYYSGTQEFDGNDPTDVLSRCKNAYYEDQAKCAANLTCTGEPATAMCMTTSTSTYYSGTQEFDGSDPADVLSRCKSAYYEDQGLCAGNLRCVGTPSTAVCTTTSTSTYYSGTQQFDGADPADVLSRCKNAYYEDQSKCAANLTCVGRPATRVCSTTSTSTYYSGTQEFDGSDADDVLSRCKSAYYEDQAACAANLHCTSGT